MLLIDRFASPDTGNRFAYVFLIKPGSDWAQAPVWPAVIYKNLKYLLKIMHALVERLSTVCLTEWLTFIKEMVCVMKITQNVAYYIVVVVVVVIAVVLVMIAAFALAIWGGSVYSLLHGRIHYKKLNSHFGYFTIRPQWVVLISC